MSVTVTRNPNLSKNQNASVFTHEINQEFGQSWWTGLSPEQCPGFDKERNCLIALPLLNLEICSRQDILDYFNNSWTLTELLFQSMKVESAYTRSPYHGLRHPMMFYYGHPAVLFINKLRIADLINAPLNPYLEKVLETGVDEMSWDDMSKNEMKWPRLREVHEYRKSVYGIIKNLILTHPDLDKKSGDRNFISNSPLWALWMGFEHEKIHFETSSVLLREMPVEFLETPKFWAPIHESFNQNETISNQWIKAPGKKVHIGKPLKTESFGWDNEYGSRDVEIKDFEYTEFQITNREFFEFVKSGAYINDKYWAAEGLEWRKFRNTKRPTFWVGVGAEGTHEYELRVLFDMIKMPWNWPCEVNYHEAIAYCHWKNESDKSSLKYRLFTEAEMRSLLNHKKDPVLQKSAMSTYQSLSDVKKIYKENFNFVYSSARNVDDCLYGNVWHWLMDQFNPLPEFKINPIYDDFSTPCFDGKHQMILGGSFMSCGHEASEFARFHFRPHFYQHAGFRMSRTLDGSSDNGAYYLVKNNESYVHPKRLNVLDQMNEKNWWQNVKQPLELNKEEVDELLGETHKKIGNYLEQFNSLHPMGEAHDPRTNGLKKDFALPFQTSKNFPENPTNYTELLNLVFDDLQKYSQLPGHAGFAAYMAGSGNFISNIAQMIAQTLNPFTGHFMMAPGPVAIEMEVINWFKEMVGYNQDEAGGYLTSGSSLAMLHAISIARNAKLNGLHNFEDVTGYTSKDSHHSIAKAWSILGLKKENLKMINLNDHRMDEAHLEKQIELDIKNKMKPFVVFLTLGSTKTGSVDNIEEIVKINKKYNLWLHADGAYGVPFLLTDTGKKALKGIQEMDSIAFDPHKALSMPYGTGSLLVKNKKIMHADYSSDDTYMPPAPMMDDQVDFSDISPELSRDFRGLRIWLPIKTLGIGVFKLNLEEKLELQKWLKLELKNNKKLKLNSNGDLSILTFKHVDGDEKTQELLSAINQKGTLFLSSCIIEGSLSIRICLLGFRLHFDRLKIFLNELDQMTK